MKKIIHLFISIMLLTTVFTGCVIAYDNPKTDESTKTTSIPQLSTEKITKEAFSETESRTSKSTTTTKKASNANNTTTTLPTTGKPSKIEAPGSLEEIVPGKKMIVLTFDDGPGAHTSRLLNVLKDNGAHATFFVLGNLAKKNSSLLKRMVDEGNEVGSHSWQHKDLSKMSYENANKDLKKASDAIKSATGKAPSLVRPPYGALNDTVKYAATMQGQAIALWNVDTRDWASRNADAVYNHIMTHASDGAIIICHDIYSSTVDAIERAVPELTARGYQFVTMSELLTYENGDLTAGQVYSKR